MLRGVLILQLYNYEVQARGHLFIKMILPIKQPAVIVRVGKATLNSERVFLIDALKVSLRIFDYRLKRYAKGKGARIFKTK